MTSVALRRSADGSIKACESVKRLSSLNRWLRVAFEKPRIWSSTTMIYVLLLLPLNQKQWKPVFAVSAWQQSLCWRPVIDSGRMLRCISCKPPGWCGHLSGKSISSGNFSLCFFTLFPWPGFPLELAFIECLYINSMFRPHRSNQVFPRFTFSPLVDFRLSHILLSWLRIERIIFVSFILSFIHIHYIFDAILGVLWGGKSFLGFSVKKNNSVVYLPWTQKAGGKLWWHWKALVQLRDTERDSVDVFSFCVFSWYCYHGRVYQSLYIYRLYIYWMCLLTEP